MLFTYFYGRRIGNVFLPSLVETVKFFHGSMLDSSFLPIPFLGLIPFPEPKRKSSTVGFFSLLRGRQKRVFISDCNCGVLLLPGPSFIFCCGWPLISSPFPNRRIFFVWFSSFLTTKRWTYVVVALSWVNWTSQRDLIRFFRVGVFFRRD